MITIKVIYIYIYIYIYTRTQRVKIANYVNDQHSKPEKNIGKNNPFDSQYTSFMNKTLPEYKRYEYVSDIVMQCS